MTDLGDIRQLLASDTVRVRYDKYKLLFLTAGILPYDIASVFSKKKKKARWHGEHNCSLCESNDVHIAHTLTKFQQLQGSQKPS